MFVALTNVCVVCCLLFVSCVLCVLFMIVVLLFVVACRCWLLLVDDRRGWLMMHVVDCCGLLLVVVGFVVCSV